MTEKNKLNKKNKLTKRSVLIEDSTKKIQTKVIKEGNKIY